MEILKRGYTCNVNCMVGGTEADKLLRTTA